VETFLLQLLAREEPAGDQIGTVVSLALGRATVEVEGERRTLRLAPKLNTETNEGGIAAGDRVTLAEDTVQTVLKRRTWLGRTDPGTGQIRAIVANVDTVVVVVSVVAPPLHPRIVDRYLIGIGRGGAEPLVAVNKIDLGREELQKLEPYRAVGIPIVPVSAGSGVGLDELRQRLAGKTCAFVGHSGVGKSSLINALMPQAVQAVGSVSEGYGRGTHTTTASATFDLGGGTRLIDTPGIRAFGLGRLTRSELLWGFPEFEAHPCRLRGCTHTHEPDCGVKEAVESGEISEFRYDTYLGLLAETPEGRNL
jgi:ribosome biogenesis GTPase